MRQCLRPKGAHFRGRYKQLASYRYPTPPQFRDQICAEGDLFFSSLGAYLQVEQARPALYVRRQLLGYLRWRAARGIALELFKGDSIKGLHARFDGFVCG